MVWLVERLRGGIGNQTIELQCGHEPAAGTDGNMGASIFPSVQNFALRVLPLAIVRS